MTTKPRERKIRCALCRHAKVGAGEICYCKKGHWMGRRLANMAYVTRAECDDCEGDDDGNDGDL